MLGYVKYRSEVMAVQPERGLRSQMSAEGEALTNIKMVNGEFKAGKFELNDRLEILPRVL